MGLYERKTIAALVIPAHCKEMAGGGVNKIPLSFATGQAASRIQENAGGFISGAFWEIG